MYVVNLAHQFIVEPLRVACSYYMDLYTIFGNLVSCEDMLLLLPCNGEAFYINFFTNPTKNIWVEDGCLKKWVLFFGEEHIG